MKKFYGFNTDNFFIKENLRSYLKENKVYYELSERGHGWHFEIKCDKNMKELIDWRLDIWERDGEVRGK